MNKGSLFCLILCQFLFKDALSDYLINKRFDSPKIWFERGNKRSSAPNEMESPDENEIETRSIVGDVKGFLKSGRCLIICIWNNPKNCMGLTICGWMCIIGNDVPPPDQNEMQSQNDDDIMNNTPDTGPNWNQQSDGMGPEDIVNFFIQLVNCIGKYVPYNKIGLKRFTICIINKAFCGSK